MSSFFNHIYWQHKEFLLLLLLPILVYLAHFIWQKWIWKQLCSDHLKPWLNVQSIENKNKKTSSLLLIIWCCFVIAIANPRTIKELPPNLSFNSSSLIIILDFSMSMNADDVFPSRKEFAIHWLEKKISQKPNDLNIGLIVFAGHAFKVIPPTAEHHVLIHFIDQVRRLKLPTHGNNLNAAIRQANTEFLDSVINKRLLILTDGDISESEEKRAETALINSVPTSLIGVGGLQPVKIHDHDKNYVLDKGRPVLSQLNKQWLVEMGAMSHVSYQSVQDLDNERLNNIVNLRKSRLSVDQQKNVTWNNWFQYPLIMGLLLFYFLLWISNKQQTLTLTTAFFIMGFMLTTSPEVKATESFQTAKKFLDQKHYKKSRQHFSQMNSAAAAFGEGLSCYRLEDFQCAVRAFSKAAWQAKNKNLRADAVFNLANSHFFNGEYDQAEVLYDDAIKLGFNQQKAKHNLNFAKSLNLAVHKRINDIKELIKRAEWRAEIAGTPRPDFNSIIAEQIDSTSLEDNQSQQFQIRKNIIHALQHIISNGDASHNATQWIRTEKVESQNTSFLLKRLFEIEIQIPASLSAPQTIEGKRPW